ncbi:MAG TPA: ATP-binding protein, partial [Methanothermobacter sp.]|nr:ATP-binding protein [Methanothermobacter sp.]
MTNVVDALSEGEGENIEFKSSLSLYDEVLKAISAFSNKTGGTIFVGINDSHNVIGIDIGKNTLENLANDVKRETDPSVYPTFI